MFYSIQTQQTLLILEVIKHHLDTNEIRNLLTNNADS